jgi:hypothetical protein
MVVMDSNRVTAPYGAILTGCYMLLDYLDEAQSETFVRFLNNG